MLYNVVHRHNANYFSSQNPGVQMDSAMHKSRTTQIKNNCIKIVLN